MLMLNPIISSIIIQLLINLKRKINLLDFNIDIFINFVDNDFVINPLYFNKRSTLMFI